MRALNARKPSAAAGCVRLGMVLAAAALVHTLGCSRRPVPGTLAIPPGIVRVPGLFRDVCPRWSHDGRRIAFLRRTTDRALQVYVASSDLERVAALEPPEHVSPDRSYDTGLGRIATPETIEWSPDDRFLAVSRPEWFTYEDGEKLVATGLWSCQVRNGARQPLAIHPRRYTRGFCFYRAPRWSPSSRYFAFLGEGIHGETALFVRPLFAVSPTGVLPRFDRYEDVGWPAWSPQGDRLAFRQGVLRAYTADPIETLRILNPGGTQAFAAAVLPCGKQYGPNPRIHGIAWSPDSRRLAFAVVPDGRTLSLSRIYLVPAAPGAAPQVLKLPAENAPYGYFAPVWLADRRLGALQVDGAGRFQAVIIELPELPGTRVSVRKVCPLPDDDVDWSPDGRWIVCADADGAQPGAKTTLHLYATGIMRQENGALASKIGKHFHDETGGSR
ncbi:MAG: hypothetical protein ACP5VE_00080 [Chthonomonadales bacterium]